MTRRCATCGQDVERGHQVDCLAGCGGVLCSACMVYGNGECLACRSSVYSRSAPSTPSTGSGNGWRRDQPRAYTYGYRGGDQDLLERCVGALGLVILDIRHLPTSRNPIWRKEALEKRFGDQYRHIPELGNELRQTGRIRLLDLAAGLERVESFGRPLLMCCCAEPAGCHRTLVARALRRRGWLVVEMPNRQGAVSGGTVSGGTGLRQAQPPEVAEVTDVAD